MKWYKIASGLTLNSNGGSTKSWPLAVQDFGLSVKDAIYGVFIISKTANAKLGIEHREGPTGDSNFHSLYATVLPVGVPAAAPSLSRANTNSAVNGPLMPFFTPTILVGDAGAVESITIDVYVGGKPF